MQNLLKYEYLKFPCLVLKFNAIVGVHHLKLSQEGNLEFQNSSSTPSSFIIIILMHSLCIKDAPKTNKNDPFYYANTVIFHFAVAACIYLSLGAL